MIPIGAIGAAISVLSRRNGKPLAIDRLGGSYFIRFMLVFPLIGAPFTWKWPSGLISALLVCALLFPLWFIRFFIIPLGSARLAWAMERIVGRSSQTKELRQREILTASRALLRRPNAKAASRLRKMLGRQLELGTAGIAAEATLALSEGDLDLARVLFRTLNLMKREEVDRDAYQCAREFCAVEALAAENWWQVLHVVRDETRAGMLLRFLRTVAMRGLGSGMHPGMFTATVDWLAAPQRRATWPILRVAAKLPRAAAPVALAAADLSALTALWSRPTGKIRRADLEAAARSLDALRADSTFAASVAQRAEARFAGKAALDASHITASLLDRLETDLVELMIAEELPLEWAPVGPTGPVLRERVLAARIDGIELLAKELERRTRAENDLSERDEWRAWGDLRLACDVVQRDGFGISALQQAIHHTCTAYAVRLCNIRTRRTLSGDVFMLVRDLTHAAGRTESYEHVNNNAEAWRSDRLPKQEGLAGEPFGNHAAVWQKRKLYNQIVLKGTVTAVFAGGGVKLLSEVLSSVPVATACILFALAATIPWLALPQKLSGARSGLAWFFRGQKAYVEAVFFEKGLMVQSQIGRFVLQRDDIVTMRCDRYGGIHIRLQRHPAWLPDRLVTWDVDESSAQACVEKFKATQQTRAL